MAKVKTRKRPTQRVTLVKPKIIKPKKRKTTQSARKPKKRTARRSGDPVGQVVGAGTSMIGLGVATKMAGKLF